MQEDNRRTAVVILNWNGTDLMRRFLPSVVRHTPTGRIIVADNGSTDDSLAMLREEFPEVQIIALPRNYGFAEGYNRALEQVKADYLLLLNSDVEVTPGWLIPLEAWMDTHPECAACQPKLLALHTPDHFEYAGACGGFLDRYGYPFCRGRLFGTVERDRGQYNTPRNVLWATGAALMIRQQDWLLSGGFDAGFFAHMEEIDLCWRLRTRGRTIACVPESVVYHKGGATLDASDPRKTYLNFRNNLLMLYKNLPTGSLDTVMRCRALLDALAALAHLVGGRPRHARAVLQARRDFRRLKSQYATLRQENLRRRTLAVLPEVYPRLLLVQYHLLRRHTFDRLKF